MSGPRNVRVDTSHGFVHAGDGDINYISIGTHLKEAGKSAFRRFADDQLIFLRRVLVAPARMGEARNVLTSTGTVILDGVPGSGRASAARVLLSEQHQDVGVFHELLPEEDALSLRDREIVGAGDRLLLDLSTASLDRWAAAQADLSSLRKAVHEQHAHLVVVMPHEGMLDSDLLRYRVVVESPPALDVFRRHLRVLGLPPEEFLRPDSTVTDLLDREPPMREIAAFADLVGRAQGAVNSGDGFAEWCKAARATRGDRSGKIAEFVTGIREGPQRALLITVAMLHGAHADVINRAAERLLRTLKHPPDEVPLLQRKDLAERLKEIDAGTGPDGHVHFRDLDYDAAIRAHFWDHMPELREYLGTWTAHSVDSNDPHVTQDLRDTLVARLASQYLRTGRGDGLASLAEGWSATPSSRNRLEAAVHLLACGLNDPIEGAGFRERVYQWCANKRLKGEFAQVLVQVCADVIAASHPDRALFRLYHLARRERGTTRALQALCGLVATSGRLRRLLLDVLARHSLSPAELGIFLQAADPEALIEPFGNSRALVEERSTQHSAITCWQAVLAGLPPATWQQYAERWLSTATGAGHRGDLLLDLIVGAADRCADKRGATFAALYACARSAERTAPAGAAQSDTTERLLRKISTAQRLGPRTTPSPTASSKGSAP